MTTTPPPPWLAFYDSVPPHLDYPALTLYEALAASAARVPEHVAWDFFGRRSSYRELLREIADKERTDDPLLLDNLELLFEPSLQINPLDLVRRLAHSKRVVAVWPGELRGDRLVYADMSHPEHRDYSRDGVVVLEI